MSSLDGDRDGASAAFGDLRHRDVQFAIGESGARVRGIAGIAEPHRASKPAEVALDQMERGRGTRPARRFLADDQNRVALSRPRARPRDPRPAGPRRSRSSRRVRRRRAPASTARRGIRRQTFVRSPGRFAGSRRRSQRLQTAGSRQSRAHQPMISQPCLESRRKACDGPAGPTGATAIASAGSGLTVRLKPSDAPGTDYGHGRF